MKILTSRAAYLFSLIAPPIMAVPVAAHAYMQPDLAAEVSGTWRGDVTADAQGSSRPGVTVTVRRVSQGIVEVSSDYGRLPTVRIAIGRVGNAIMNNGGTSTFLIETNRDPRRLDLYIDGAALIVRR